jgi:hypothetical protein
VEKRPKWVPKKPRNEPGTITCICSLKSGGGQLFMLTAGHAWYDMDVFRTKTIMEDTIAHRIPNQTFYYWGEPGDDDIQHIGPFAKPFGMYHRMGDKVGSQYDAGLAEIEPGVVWNNMYAPQDYGKHQKIPHVILRSLDVQWPPRNADGIEFRCREVTIPFGEFIVCDAFESDFETWDGKTGCTIQKALLRKRPYAVHKTLGMENFDWVKNGTSCMI